MIVHHNNSLESLTVVELAAIYKGQKSKWGNGKKIVVTNRPIASSIRARFYKQALRAKPSKKFRLRGSPLPFKTTRVKSDLATRKFVSRVPNAIGYISLSQVDHTVKVLNIAGTAPSPASSTSPAVSPPLRSSASSASTCCSSRSASWCTG